MIGKTQEVIDESTLSNGDKIIITKLGGQYSFERLFKGGRPPYTERGLTLKQAISLLGRAVYKDIMKENKLRARIQTIERLDLKGIK